MMKEPTGLSRSDGRCPDGLTLIPRQNRKSLTWDITVATTLAVSYINASANFAGAAASRKSAKYADLPTSYIFQSTALETLDPMNSSAMEFFVVLGRKIGASSGDKREGRFLFQRLSMTLQRYNAVLLHKSFVGVDDRDL